MEFKIDTETLNKINEWKATLPKVASEGAIGGRFTYKFTNTSLGLIIKVHDGISDTEKDFTDYDAW